jgi:hypothetical protein
MMIRGLAELEGGAGSLCIVWPLSSILAHVVVALAEPVMGPKPLRPSIDDWQRKCLLLREVD